MWALLVLLAVVGISVFAYDFIEYQFERRVLYAQTHIAVERCVEKNGSEVVSEEIIKDLCAAAESKAITGANGEATGSAGFDSFDGVPFEGNITNKFDNHIITSYEIVVIHYQVDENQLNSEESLEIPEMRRDTFSVENVWIEPNGVDRFAFYESQMEYVPNMPVYDNDAVNWSWYLSNIRGVEISVK